MFLGNLFGLMVIHTDSMSAFCRSVQFLNGMVSLMYNTIPPPFLWLLSRLTRLKESIFTAESGISLVHQDSVAHATAQLLFLMDIASSANFDVKPPLMLVSKMDGMLPGVTCRHNAKLGFYHSLTGFQLSPDWASRLFKLFRWLQYIPPSLNPLIFAVYGRGAGHFKGRSPGFICFKYHHIILKVHRCIPCR